MSSGRVILPLPVRKRSWLSLSHLWVGSLLLFGLQLILVIWFGERRTAPVRSPSSTQTIKAADAACAEVLQLLNPTLFALPHEKGFSGPGWLIPTNYVIQPFTWSDPARWLALSTARLGIPEDLATSETSYEPIPFPIRREPDLLLPQISASRSFPENSSARFEGALANLQLLTPLHLPSWPHTELLRPSAVQVLLDPEGVPFSVSLLERSGSPAADKHALSEARRARFKPLRRANQPTVNDFTCGTIVFEWHTLPSPPTSLPATSS